MKKTKNLMRQYIVPRFSNFYENGIHPFDFKLIRPKYRYESEIKMHFIQ